MIAKFPLNHSRATCLSMHKGEKGRIWANRGHFRAFRLMAIYLPISPLGTLKTAYFGQKRKVPNLILFNTIIFAICNLIYIFAVF